VSVTVQVFEDRGEGGIVGGSPTEFQLRRDRLSDPKIFG
jgi:hypothetical protein